MDSRWDLLRNGNVNVLYEKPSRRKHLNSQSYWWVGLLAADCWHACDFQSRYWALGRAITVPGIVALHLEDLENGRVTPNGVSSR
jgi:hypothetical protein